MEFLKLLVSNYYIDVAIISWFSAQLIKTLLFYLKNGVLQIERMVGAGGMPSANTAFVCSLTIALAKKVGYGSPEFALALAFSCVVMYDAMGVRRAAGEQGFRPVRRARRPSAVASLYTPRHWPCGASRGYFK